jgi:hypothetical protein
MKNTFGANNTYDHAPRISRIVLALGFFCCCTRAPGGPSTTHSVPEGGGPPRGNTTHAETTHAETTRAETSAASMLHRIRVDEKTDGVIVPADLWGAPGRYWTPTDADVREFEAGLSGFLRQARPKEAPDLAARTSLYRRQYSGVVQNDKRMMFVFFFCRDVEGWLIRPVTVDDGGACFFDVKYDPSAKKYIGVSVHHDA